MARVVVIGHDLWRAQFGADPNVVGRPLLIEGAPFAIVGVMPPAFGFPTSHQFWMPLRATDDGAGPVLAAGCAVIAGVAPAVRMTGRSIEANIRRSRASHSGNRLGGLSSALIVLDVAVAVVAIGVAGGLWGKIQATLPDASTDGIRAEEILSVTLDVHSTRRQQVARTQTALVERLRGEPGVRAVTFATALPRMDHPNRLMDVDQDGAAGATPAPGPLTVREARIAIDFFDQLEQPLVAGRGFDFRDLRKDARTIIVNTTFAQRAFGSANPIGRRVRQATPDRGAVAPWLEIIGVVGHMGVHALTPSQDDGVYLPLAEGDVNPVRLAIWARGDPALLAPRVAELARTVDPDATVALPIPLDEMFEGDWYLLTAFVLGAVVLVGVLLSLAVSALYAILSLGQSCRSASACCSACRSRPCCRTSSFELIGAGRSVPRAMAMASGLGVAVMSLVSFTACALPTLRALRIAPSDALRSQG